MLNSAPSTYEEKFSEERVNEIYIERETERKFLEEFENSLDLGAPHKNNNKPFLFLIDGMGGIGKHVLIEKLKQRTARKFKEVQQAKPIIIDIDFGRADAFSNPIDLMEYIDNKIEEEKIKIRDDFSFQNSSSKHRATNDFYKSIQTYRLTLQKLCTDPIKKDSSVDSKQLENVREITKWGGRIIASYAVASAGMPALIPLASSLGSEAGEVSPTIAQVILTAKDELLNKHKATRGNEDLQKLILLPLEVLTPKFIDSLIQRSRKNAIIIIFESHEKTKINNNSIKLDDWFSKLFLSPRSKFIEEKNDHLVRFVISARKNLTSRPDWSQLKEYDRDKFCDIHLDYFSRSEVGDFLKHRLGRIYKDLSDDEEDRFFKITHGHPKYLELICKQRENSEEKREDSENFDYSEINLEIAQEFLADLSNSQKRVIQRVSCCRWLDRKLTEDYAHRLKDILPDENASGFKWFDWLIQRHFVKLTNDKYHFDDLSRQVFRRSLFQEDRDSFYRVHQELADYFKRKADQLLPEKPVFSKYDDPDWCEYIGEYLYHACFAQSKDFQAEYIYHLFASSYLNKNRIINHSFHAVINESDLDHHPLIHSSTRAFLKSLSFISTYSWVAFELDSNTDCGKYQSEIEAATLLCKSHLESLEEGIGKVAVLEYIIKNLTPNISDDERKLYRSKLLEEIERTANPIDPDFSSKLFMQSVCWQIDIDSSLKWCEKAINYKPDNPNAWYRKGLIIERQANENLDQKIEQCLVFDRLNESLACYERALDIQPYDHRFWLSRGNVLMQLGDSFRCRVHQMLEESDLTPRGKITMPDSGDVSILQKAAYYQRALESYREAYRFRPNDRSLKKAIDDAVENRDNELNKLNQFTLKAEYKGGNNSADINDLEEYSQLIQRGDEIRLNSQSVNEDKTITENRFRTALDLYCKAIFQKPEYPLGWYSRGLAYAELGKLKKSQEYLRMAISDYSKSLSIKSDLDWAFYDRGIAYYQLARIQEKECNRAEAHAEYEYALSDFDSAINLNLEYETAWSYRGLVLASIDRHPEAIASYDKALQIYKSKEQIEDGAFTWYDRGRSCAELGLHEEAIASYQQSDLEFKGSNFNLLYDLAFSLQQLERYKEAVIHYNSVIKICQKEKEFEKEVDAWYHLGNSLRSYQSNDDAIASYKHSLRLNRRHDLSWIALIEMLLEKANKYVENKNIFSAVEQFNLVADRIEVLMKSDVSDNLKHSLREYMYKSSHGILKLISSDEHIRQKFLRLGEKSFMLLSQDKDYRVRFEAESGYQEISKHWIYLAKA